MSVPVLNRGRRCLTRLSRDRGERRGSRKSAQHANELLNLARGSLAVAHRPGTRSRPPLLRDAQEHFAQRVNEVVIRLSEIGTGPPVGVAEPSRETGHSRHGLDW